MRKDLLLRLACLLVTAGSVGCQDARDGSAARVDAGPGIDGGATVRSVDADDASVMPIRVAAGGMSSGSAAAARAVREGLDPNALDVLRTLPRAIPLAALGAPADGTIGTPVLSGSGPGSYSFALGFSGAIDNTPLAATQIGGVTVSYTSNGTPPPALCAAGPGVSLSSTARLSITGYNAVAGSGTVNRSGLSVGAYQFRVCAYDNADNSLTADGALSGTVYATTVPASGMLTAAIVSGSDLALSFTGMSDPDAIAIQGVKVSYRTDGIAPAANCASTGAETIVSVPVASIASYSPAGTGTVNLTGLSPAQYQIRVCAVDATNTALVSTGATITASLPVVMPANGAIASAVVSGSAPSSYSVALGLSGVLADDMGIQSVKVAYRTDGGVPALACVGGVGETVATVLRSSIASYVPGTGVGTVTRSGLSAGNYTFRVCAVDSNDGTLVADGATTTATVTTVPNTGSVGTAVVNGSDLALGFSGMTDPDNLALYGLKVAYRTDLTNPTWACVGGAGETVTTVPAGSLTAYTSGTGSGTVTLSGLAPATYRLRVCAVDGTNTALAASGATIIASLPVVKPADGLIVSATVGGSAPSSYSVTLSLSGFTADDMGIQSVKVSYTSNGTDPNVGCVGGGGETTSTIAKGSISGYNATTGVGSLSFTNLAAKNYKFRVCGVDANDSAVVADGSMISTATTTAPNSGTVTTAVVTGSNLTVAFTGMTDADNVSLDGVKVSYRTDASNPATNCLGGAGETVLTFPVAAITGYSSGSGAGSVTLSGLVPATYRLRLCAVDGTNTALVASGTTTVASLPGAIPANGTILSAPVGGSAPSSYSVTLNLSGFTADDNGIQSVKVSYTSNGNDPALGCGGGVGETTSTILRASISGYNSSTGTGSVSFFGLSARNYKFRVCSVDANDAALVADGAMISVATTTVPNSGFVGAAVVSGGSNLALTFTSMTDPDNVAIDGVKVSYRTDGGVPASNCNVVAGETVVTVPVASIASYNSGTGSGVVTLTGLGSATYKLRVCAIDGTNTALVAGGNTITASLPVVKPASGSILSATVGGTGPWSYSVVLGLTGFTADDMGIGQVRVVYTTNGATPAVGCVGGAGETVTSTSVGSITGYSAVTGAGSVTRSGLAYGNYTFRVCGRDYNDTSIFGDGATYSVALTTAPVSGSLVSAVVSASNLSLGFSGMTDVDPVALNGVKVSYLTNGSTPAAGCSVVAGETVVSVPTGSLTGYSSGAGSGTVTLGGLAPATYKLRVCPIDGTNPSLVASGATITASLPVVQPAKGTIATATVSGTAPSFQVDLSLSGFTADDMGISGVKVAYTTNGSAPAVGCVGGAGETVATTALASITGYNATTGVGTVSRTGLGAGNYQFRVCGVDANDVSVTGDGATIKVTAPVVVPANGTISGAKIAPRTAFSAVTGIATYTAYLNLTGFTADDEGIGGVRIRVNAGTAAPAAGCGTTGSFSSGAADRGATGLGVMPTGYVALTGAGSIAVPNLIIDAGATQATYTIRVCAVEANSSSVVANGTTFLLVIRPDVTAPANGTIDASSATYDLATGEATIPLSSGFTDDRGVDHFVVRVNTGVTAPASGCGTKGNFSSGASDATAYSAVTAGILPGTPYDAANPAVTGNGSLTVSGLTASAAGIQYTIRVCAVDVEGNTAPGATTRVAAKSGDPTAPATATLTATPTVAAIASPVQRAAKSSASGFTLSCPNPADVISSITAEYGSPTLTGTSSLVADTACTPGAAAVSTAVAALTYAGAPCIGQRSCSIPAGLATTPLSMTPGYEAPAVAKSCPSSLVTAAIIDCTSNWTSDPDVLLTLGSYTPTAGDEICISNTAITSLGTTSTTRGPCATGWKPLVGTGQIYSALTGAGYPWALSAGDGLKSVYVKIHDAAFNESEVATATARLDTVAPARRGLTAKTSSATGTVLQNLVYWNKFVDSGSGVGAYKLVYTTNGVLPPLDCSDTATSSVKLIPATSVGWVPATGSVDEPPTASAPFAHNQEYTSAGAVIDPDGAGPLTGTPLTGGTVYTYRVCATDRQGRSSTLAVGVGGVTSATYAPGSPGSAVAAPNYNAPSWAGGSSFTLADRGGAIAGNWSNSVYVNADTTSLVALAGAGNALGEYCFSRSNQASSCTEAMWDTLANAASAINVGGGDGTKTIYAHVRDTYRTTSASPSTMSATIKLDRTAPSNPTLTLTPGTDQITIKWTTSTESGSGLAAQDEAARTPYKIVYNVSSSTTKTASAPPSCGSGTARVVTDAERAARTVVHTGLATGRTYAYRLCVSDTAGNRSAGVTKSAKPN